MESFQEKGFQKKFKVEYGNDDDKTSFYIYTTDKSKLMDKLKDKENLKITCC